MPPLGGSGRAIPRLMVATVATLVSLVPSTARPPAAAAVAAVAEPRVTVRTADVDLGPAGPSRRFTVDCGPNEELLSGGYFAADPALRVLSSYPSDPDGTPTGDGQRPRSWTVVGLNSGRAAVGLRIAANCLASDDPARATVAAVSATRTEPRFTLAARCDSGPPRTGGGYSTGSTPSTSAAGPTGAAGIRGSYPADRGWEIEVAAGPADPDVRSAVTVTVYAICLSTKSVEVHDGRPVELDLIAGTPVCTAGAQLAAVSCVTPRSGETTATCPTGQRVAGAGYRTDPRLAASTALASGPVAGAAAGPADSPRWTVAVRGSTAGPAAGAPSSAAAGPSAAATTPVRAVVTAVCMAARVPPSIAPTGPLAAVPLPRPGGLAGAVLIAGVLSLLVLLALLGLLLARHRHRRGEPPPGLEIVVRGSRGGYRIGGPTR